MKNIKFRYWNGVSNIMVNEPKMPYKKGWTITQLFSERSWVWMQFTGLLDKNGKEIYEFDWFSIKGKQYEIKWVGAGFWLVNPNEKDIEPTQNEMQHLKIIGNKYEKRNKS